jgi:RNA polymerase sigma factor (sigma-70 family)
MRNFLQKYYEDNYDKFVKMYSRSAGHGSEDVVQEAFTRALRTTADPTFKVEKPEAWFGIILSNSLKDYQNTMMHQGMSTYDEWTEAPEPMAEWEQDMIKAIKQLMMQHKPRVQDVLHLYFFREFKPREIAEVTEFTSGAVRDMILRFKAEVEAKYGEVVKD